MIHLPRLCALLAAGALLAFCPVHAKTTKTKAKTKPKAPATQVAPKPGAITIEPSGEDADEERLQRDLPFNIDVEAEAPTVDPEAWMDTVVVHPAIKNFPASRFSDLTEADYRAVAAELGLETAVIKAVVDIEAGKSHQGFWRPMKPVINFDLSMYRRFAPDHGVSIKTAQKKKPVIFMRPNVKKYGSYQGGQYARLEAAYELNRESAMKSAFWGMFQIGGFNWRKCGTSNVEEFVKLMSRSERDQLELFGRFIRNSGMLDDLRNKRWLAFATKYNGPRAKARGYHTRLAAAYAHHVQKEAEAVKESALNKRVENLIPTPLAPTAAPTPTPVEKHKPTRK